jgi:ribose transport system ATP-binding protein
MTINGTAMFEPTHAPENVFTSVAGVPRLMIRNLSKTFSGQAVLSKFDLTVERGEIHALVGQNGSGKSTCIKILSGYHKPDPGGEIRLDGTEYELGSAHAARLAGCRFVHQDLGLANSLSILDNLAIGTGYACRWGTVRARENRQRARVALEFVGLDLDPRTPVATLSPVERTGVAIARALHGFSTVPARLLVLDEPTATLPNPEVEKLLSMIRTTAASGVSVLYVSHRLDEIFRIADNVTVLRDGQKVATQPTTTLTRPKLVNLLVGSEFDEVRSVSSERHVRPTAPIVLEAQGVSCPSLNDVSLAVHAGEIIGIAGITGSGRESLLAALFGAIPRAAGTVVVNETVIPPDRPDRSVAAGMAYIPADRKIHGAFLNLTARENLTAVDSKSLWRAFRISGRTERSEVSTWFEKLSVRPKTGTEREFSTFSGGNQQKIVFGKWFRLNPRVILLDEPTQGVDVGAKAELHAHIMRAADEGAAVIVSSSEVDELVAICDRVRVLQDGRFVTEIPKDQLSASALSKATLGLGSEKDDAL